MLFSLCRFEKTDVATDQLASTTAQLHEVAPAHAAPTRTPKHAHTHTHKHTHPPTAMLSLIYSKPALAAPDATRAHAGDDSLPKIVDFNTIEQAAGTGGAGADAGAAKRGGFFGMWPFGRAKSAVASTPAAAHASVLDDAHDRVIAMKKIDSSVLHDGASVNRADDCSAAAAAADTCADEDFIDIQLRQLSYAEVAALNLAASEAQSSQKASSRPSAAAAAAAMDADAEAGNENILVIDQVEALGKSITDLEMLDSFKKYEKFNSDRAPPCTDGLSPEDQWDLYVEGKTPKKIIRKKKNHKQKKAAHN